MCQIKKSINRRLENTVFRLLFVYIHKITLEKKTKPQHNIFHFKLLKNHIYKQQQQSKKNQSAHPNTTVSDNALQSTDLFLEDFILRNNFFFFALNISQFIFIQFFSYSKWAKIGLNVT